MRYRMKKDHTMTCEPRFNDNWVTGFIEGPVNNHLLSSPRTMFESFWEPVPEPDPPPSQPSIEELLEKFIEVTKGRSETVGREPLSNFAHRVLVEIRRLRGKVSAANNEEPSPPRICMRCRYWTTADTNVYTVSGLCHIGPVAYVSHSTDYCNHFETGKGS